MERKHHTCPSFLKLLMEEDFRKQIRIPNAFTRDFKKKLSRKCILKGTAGKKSWPVRICRKGNNFYIWKHAWPKFVKDHKLKYGDYVLFLLVKKRTFEVITYGGDGNRKLDVSSDEESDSSSGYDDGFESLEDEDGDGNDDDDSDDDTAVDDYDPFKRQSTKNASNKKFKPSRNNNSGDNEGKQENENDIEGGDSFRGHNRTNLENPYFVKKLSPSNRTQMTIPTRFVKETNLNSQEKIALQHGEDERKWTVKMRRSGGMSMRYFFEEGWTRFLSAYKVKIGDTCKFTLLKTLGNVFTVEIMH